MNSNDIEIITYATKDEGLFQTLVHNDFNAPVTVLGWGTEWVDFSDKCRGLLNYIASKKDDDIIIFLDGFDTFMHKDPYDVTNQLLDKFKKYNCKILFTDNNNHSIFIKHIWKTCRKNMVLNSGMYIGYVSYIRIVLNDLLKYKCKDDQVVLNKLCSKYDFIDIDTEQLIFRNISAREDYTEYDSIFMQIPGAPTKERSTRKYLEYTQFFFMYILLFMIVLYTYLPLFRLHIFIFTLSLCVLFFKFCTRTCSVMTDLNYMIMILIGFIVIPFINYKNDFIMEY